MKLQFNRHGKVVKATLPNQGDIVIYPVNGGYDFFIDDHSGGSYLKMVNGKGFEHMDKVNEIDHLFHDIDNAVSNTCSLLSQIFNQQIEGIIHEE